MDHRVAPLHSFCSLSRAMKPSLASWRISAIRALSAATSGANLAEVAKRVPQTNGRGGRGRMPQRNSGRIQIRVRIRQSWITIRVQDLGIAGFRFSLPRFRFRDFGSVVLVCGFAGLHRSFRRRSLSLASVAVHLSSSPHTASMSLLPVAWLKVWLEEGGGSKEVRN